ncbi:hypothetical protein C8R46DRAFT_118944 [Mycena filopes]|nr:hypothetical protein C8R46DRAFT_118944 [Mycena filopes]
MPGFKSFAVIGAGTVGLPLVSALVAQNAAVVILTRPGSKKSAPADVKVPVVPVDLNDAEAVAAVLKAHKVEVVLSTIAPLPAGTQNPLVDAAKLASVKLFVPSEYGTPTDGYTGGLLAPKNAIIEYLKTVGIPSLRVYTGPFPEFVAWLVDYDEHKTVKIIGKGEAPVSFTAIADVVGFLAYVLTTLPASEFEENRIFRLEGERASLRDVAAQFNAPIEYVESIPGEPAKTYLLGLAAIGAASTGWDVANKKEGTGSNAAGSANALWPGYQWKTIKEVLNLDGKRYMYSPLE